MYRITAAALAIGLLGGYDAQLAPEFRALLVFNHANTPQDGDTISKNFPLDFGN